MWSRIRSGSIAPCRCVELRSILEFVSPRSAEFYSALSPSCTRQSRRICGSIQGIGRGAECNSAVQQSATLRYIDRVCAFRNQTRSASLPNKSSMVRVAPTRYGCPVANVVFNPEEVCPLRLADLAPVQLRLGIRANGTTASDPQHLRQRNWSG